MAPAAGGRPATRSACPSPDTGARCACDRSRAKESHGCGAGMLLVTGGAGFIGSNVVAGLNEAGRADIAVCDELGTGEKWRNLAKRQLADIVPPQALVSWLEARKLDAVIHLRAISHPAATEPAA